MCFGGVFGGLHTGVTDSTTNIFLESAWFNPVAIRNTSIRHSLRTDAAIRFEKGVDISQTVQVLKRAATMIKEIAGGEIASNIIDVYPNPKQEKSVTLHDSYLKKISGKTFTRQTVKNILQSLGFEFEKEQQGCLDIVVPFNKADISLPADIVEEIMRIDGYDNVCIPSVITIAPAIETGAFEAFYKEKVSNYLIGSGFSEIFTNSITNSSYYDAAALINSVKIINSLSVDLDIMRPALMENGLHCIAYNLNRKNNDLLLFEFGNSYSVTGIGEYDEKEHLCVYISGNRDEFGWKRKPIKGDFFFLKGISENIFTACGLSNVQYSLLENNRFENGLSASINGELIAEMGIVNKNISEKFSIKQQILFADLNWKIILNSSKNVTIEYVEIPKFPAVHRDLSLIVNKNISYAQIENLIKNLSINKLVNVKLFDVFESDKIGFDKKSYAVSFTFTDMEKTLTDKEIDSMMKNISGPLEKKLGAEIRK
jgi:phenylalanyl-tRNA synthetase beta chain